MQNANQGENSPSVQAETAKLAVESHLPEREEPRNMKARELHNAAPTTPIPNIDLYNAVVEQQVSFFDTIVKNYDKDTFFKKVMDAPERYKNFSLHDGLIVMENVHHVTCIPLSIFKGRRSMEIIVDRTTS
jgi:hypothetical protein